ncbi:hypothetical protein ILUMI_22381 [Ignelater luminosus]|uniref:Uncharacterized protein n=1 Tax=Ignelater luminosus TaxID=2038154 RepID=A0A8K0CH87_IGNLU|nr:hypothetical protein ILUMI_22381 [Ignelater luminosus]
MPNVRKKTTYSRKYKKEDIQKAIEKVENGMSKLYEIRRPTLIFCLTKKFVKTDYGPNPLLIENEENTLVESGVDKTNDVLPEIEFETTSNREALELIETVNIDAVVTDYLPTTEAADDPQTSFNQTSIVGDYYVDEDLILQKFSVTDVFDLPPSPNNSTSEADPAENSINIFINISESYIDVNTSDPGNPHGRSPNLKSNKRKRTGKEYKDIASERTETEKSTNKAKEQFNVILEEKKETSVSDIAKMHIISDVKTVSLQKSDNGTELYKDNTVSTDNGFLLSMVIAGVTALYDHDDQVEINGTSESPPPERNDCLETQ